MQSAQSPTETTTTGTTTTGTATGHGHLGGNGRGGLSITSEKPQGGSVSGAGEATGGERQRRHPAGGSPQQRHHHTAGAHHGGTQGGAGGANAHNGIAPPPQLVASQAETLSSLLGNPAVSVQALDYYRIPLFLLPIYQAAAAQYGVPWQVLAAINEVETNYGNDLAVSTAGAIGWMQFMPETWLQYGVDVQDAGYADPYNPVDAIFAAARYLKAAGAASNLNRAIFAYNHSQAYVQSVLLRAQLIGHYPTQVIATLTGLA